MSNVVWWSTLAYTLFLVFLTAIATGFAVWCAICFVRAWFPLDLTRYRWYWTLRRWF